LVLLRLRGNLFCLEKRKVQARACESDCGEGDHDDEVTSYFFHREFLLNVDADAAQSAARLFPVAVFPFWVPAWNPILANVRQSPVPIRRGRSSSRATPRCSCVPPPIRFAWPSEDRTFLS